MGFNIDYFLKINNSYGTTSKKDSQLYNIKSFINDRFDDTIDFYSVLKNGENQDFLIVRTSKEDIKSIKARPDENFNIGDVIDWCNLKWLVVSKDYADQVYASGKIKKCNFTLKWQASDGTILSYPCITDSKRLGETDGKVITLGNNEKSVILPLNEITVLLKNSENKKWRFFLDKHPTSPTPYVLENTDNTSHDGLVELIVKEDVLNPNTDRPDLGVCDYFEPTTPPDPIDPDEPQVVVVINHDATDNEVKLGLTYNFSASFTREDGSVVETTNPKYTINTTYGGLITLVDNGDGTATVKVKNDAYDLVIKQFTLECMDMYSGFSSAVTLTIVGMW